MRLTLAELKARRERIAAEIAQIQTDMDSYNENWNTSGVPVTCDLRSCGAALAEIDELIAVAEAREAAQ